MKDVNLLINNGVDVNASLELFGDIDTYNETLEDFLNMGFDGIEAIYFQNTPDEEKYFLNFAKKHNLLVSAGSDCHGNVDGDERHGDIGAMNITEDLLETFLEKYNTL